ncbi:hypothetical protein EVA_06911 [gut metagenome]|uniref:Uncharacterized protein n=1 Tax=gut metagenome TaxID=749906 RepID=J9GCA5_9ZZZZ
MCCLGFGRWIQWIQFFRNKYYIYKYKSMNICVYYISLIYIIYLLYPLYPLYPYSQRPHKY